MRRALLLAVGVALLGAGGGASEPLSLSVRNVEWSPDGRLLALAAWDGEDTDVYVVRPDGSGLRRLAPLPDPDSRVTTRYEPAWRPGGHDLAFTAQWGVACNDCPRAGWDLRVIGRDGRGMRTVVTGGSNPDWAPDGRKLAYDVRTLDFHGESEGVAVVPTRGGRSRVLVKWGAEPSWSPDGRRIAYTLPDGPERQSVVYVMRADGTRHRRIGLGGGPAWSPDGRSLAFTRSGIYVARVDGNAVRRLSRLRVDGAPRFSPDGARLAFSSRGTGYVVDVSTGQRRRIPLVKSALSSAGVSWSPDGRRVAFGTATGIVVVGGDGTNRRLFRLTPP